MPPTMLVLARGTATVLGASVLASAVIGAVAGSATTALNALGFIGGCALALAVIFYSVALERVGIHAARTAASVLVVVLGGSALLMTGVLVALLARADIRAEAGVLGLHSAVGAAVLVVLGALLLALWRDRRRP